jgi:hypothetical protein
MITGHLSRGRLPVCANKWLLARYLLAALIVAHPAASQAADGFQLNEDWSGKPAWLDLRVIHRSQPEFLDGQFRNGREGSDQAWLLQTSLYAGFKLEKFRLNTELFDAQIRLADSGTPINNGLVDPVDILQANIEISAEDFLQQGSMATLKLGRFTADVGSRRFLARQRYRNTINSFTGMHLDWRNAAGNRVQLVHALPVTRYFDGEPLYFHPRQDREYSAQKFSLLQVAYSKGLLSDNTEFELFSINEDDSPALQTRDREIYSVGLRQFRTPALARWSYEVEALVQRGSLRKTSSPADTVTLDHSAWYLHFNLDYTFDHPWQPRLGIVYDHGSGDGNPGDLENGEFESLYGVPRPDFGPTNLYGPVLFGNLVSPGARLVLRPLQGLTTTITARKFSLASGKGAWSRAGYPASALNEHEHLGTQLETRIQYTPSGNFSLDAGFTWLDAGSYLQARQKGDSRVLYLGLTFSI